MVEPQGAPIPSNERRRLETLRGYEILDTLAESVFDDLVSIAAEVCDTPMALLTLVDEQRQWFKARLGIDVTETPRNVSFCAYTALEPDRLLIVPDALEDQRFADNPLVTQSGGIRFYAGAPLVAPDGAVLGALCVADRVPRELAEGQMRSLAALGRQAIAQMELRIRLREADAKRLALQREHLRLALQSMSDPLTGIANRRAFDERLRTEYEAINGHNRPLALLLLDVDHFKSFNDAFGHARGDDTLRALAALLRDNIRAGDLAARVGGEEFALILPETTPQAATAVAEKLRAAVERQAWPSRAITVSVGVALVDEALRREAAPLERLYERADGALYASKAGGRNRVTLAASDVQRTPREARYSS